MKNPFKLSLHVSLLLLFTVVTAVTAQTPTQSPEPSRGLGIPSNTTQRSSSEKNGPTTAKPELVLQTGHTKPVNAIAISPDGRWLASGSEDNTTKIWDLATGSVLRTLTGHTKRVYTVAISPDGRWLASGSEDDTVKLWDVNTGSEAHTLGGHSFPVSGVAFSPDSRRLVSVSRDSAKVWDVAAGSELRSFRISDKGDVEMVAVSPDARLVAAGGGWSSGGAFGIAGAFSVGASHKPIKLFDVATGREVAALKIGEKNALGDIAFSPDGRLLAARIRDQKGTIKLWDTAGGRQLQSLQSGDLYGTGAVAFSSDGRWLVSRNTGKPDDAAGVMIEIWEVTTGRSVRGLKLGGKYSALTLRDSKSDPIVFSPDGRILAAGKASAVKLWDVATWSELRTLETNDKAAPASPTASNPMLEALKSQGINVEDFNEMMKSALGAVEASGISGLGNAAFAFSPDGRWLFSENEPSGWWDIATGTKVRGPMPTGQASFGNGTFGHSAFSPDGRLFAALERDSSGGATISIRETGTWREVRTIPLGNQSAPNFAFGPDGRWLSLMSTNMKGAISIKLFDISSGNELRTFQTDNRYGIGNVVFSPDGRFMISEGVDLGGGFGRGFGLGGLKGSLKGSFPGLGRDATPTIPGQEYKIKLWDVESGRQLRALNTTAAYTSMPATAFSRDGSMMAVAGYKNNAATIHIYRLPSGTEVSTLNTGGQNSAITVLSFSPDGRILAMAGREPRSALAQRRKASQSASPDNVVTLWEVGSGRKILTLAHTGGVNGVAFSPNGRIVVTRGQDGNKYVWDIETGEQLATLVGLGSLGFFANTNSDWLVVTPDGLFDGSPAGWNHILWRFSQNTFDVEPVETFFNEFYYPELLADIMAGKRPKPAQGISEKDRRQPQLTLALADRPTSAGGGSIDGNTPVTTRTIKVQINVKDAPAGARDVRLFRNGSLVKVWHGDVLKGESSATLEAAIPIIAGDNRLTAYAFNHDNVKSKDATLPIKGADNLKRAGTAYVLAVGINSYANSQYNLKYAVADAQAFGKEVAQEQAQMGHYAHVEVIPLVDQDATKANILTALKRLAGGEQEALPAGALAVLQKLRAAQPEDAVIIYYAGHGTAQQQRFYLIPYDLGYTGERTRLDATGLQTILAHSISDEELQQALEGVDAGQLLLVIDACNSGQALEAEEKRRGPMNSKGLAQLAYEKGMYILTAAQGYQAALEAAQLGHGYLTYALVEEGLKSSAADNEPKDGVVTVREWFDYATERVPQMQQEKMEQGRGVGINISFVEGEEAAKEPEKRSIQRPRAFYRRELEGNSLIVAKTAANQPEE